MTAMARRLGPITRLIGLVCILASLASCGATQEATTAEQPLDPDAVSFKGIHHGFFSSPVTLTGTLKKPVGAGPFPAVVLLHGCAGKQPARDDLWAQRLVDWGYVALLLDSFRARGISNVCAGGFDLVFVDERAGDAYDAKRYLAALPFVDPGRIAVLGWSHGGITVLRALSFRDEPPFRAAIAFYPYCYSGILDGRNAPALILMGDADDWTPAERCVSEMPSGNPSPDLVLKVYRGAYHDFDRPGPDVEMQGFGSGHLTRYDRDADRDAVVEVQSFLQRYVQ
jgi:dienelactone hydrolase